MKLALVFAFVSTLFLLGHACSGDSIFVFGKCPNVCTADVSSLFLECAGLKQLGCEIKPCGAGQFSCRLEEDSIPDDVEICPGGELVFETLEVDKPFSIFIDLQAQPLPLDLYLLADDTGSMEGAIATVKTQFSNLINFFKDEDLFEDPHFGVGAFRDEADAGFDNGFKNLHPINPDADLAQNAVNTLVAKGGGDDDEANLVALYKIATDPSIKWRERSRKIVAYFGDFPGHEPTCGPFGTLTRDTVIKALNKKNITVIGISLAEATFDQAPIASFGCGGVPPAGPNQASDITTATSGILRVGSDATIIEDIKEAVRNLPATFSVDTSDCEGKLKSIYDPNLPLELEAGDVQRVKQTVSVPVKYCDESGDDPNFTCQIDYIESGVFLPPTTIVAKKIVGCP